MEEEDQLREAVRYLEKVVIPYLKSECQLTREKLDRARYQQIKLAEWETRNGGRPSQNEFCLRAKAETTSLTRLLKEQEQVIELRQNLLQQTRIKLELVLLEQQKQQVRLELAKHQQHAQELRLQANHQLLRSVEETIHLSQQQLEALDWGVISFRQMLTPSD